jgi:hypothetical protein
MAERNIGLPPERHIEFRVGIHLGDVVEESDGDLMGDGVSAETHIFTHDSRQAIYNWGTRTCPVLRATVKGSALRRTLSDDRLGPLRHDIRPALRREQDRFSALELRRRERCRRLWGGEYP